MQRDAVWRELDKHFQPGMRILELNCGTGVDAVHLAGRGVHVVACDLSSRMIDAARKRLGATGLGGLVDFRVLATEEIGRWSVRPLSTGLSPTFQVSIVCRTSLKLADDLARLLKPALRLLLCMVGRFSLWEMAWHLAKGKPAVAVRSFKRKPTTHISAQKAVFGSLSVR